MEYGFSVDKNTPTVKLGDGTVGVVDVYYEGGVGVAMFPAPENKVVGAVLNREFEGKSTDELDLRFQMLFDNPASIDVVIGRLKAAKQVLTGQSEKPVTEEFTITETAGELSVKTTYKRTT